MLFLTALEQRIIIVSIVQSWPIFYSIFFTYKLLIRSKNPPTLTLSLFFLVNMIGLILFLVSIFTVYTPFSYLFYLSGYYLFSFSYSFLILFSWLVLNVDKIVSKKLIVLIILIYLISYCYIFLFGIFYNGISYGPSTGWIPGFSIISWLFNFVLFIIPEGYIIYRLINVFQHSPIKRRIFFIWISIILGFSILNLGILYNYLIDNTFYRTIHIFITLPLNTIAAYLMYSNLVKGLK